MYLPKSVPMSLGYWATWTSLVIDTTVKKKFFFEVNQTSWNDYFWHRVNCRNLFNLIRKQIK